MKDISKNIKALRISKGFTQESLAQALYVTRQTVSNYETGKSRPDIEMVMRISDVLGVDANTILYGEEAAGHRLVARKQWVTSSIITAGLGILYLILMPLARKIAAKVFLLGPKILIQLLLLPCFLFMLGCTGMQIISYLLNLTQKSSPGFAKAIRGLRICLIAAGCLYLVFIIPYIVWLMVGLIQSLANTSVAMHFPEIPVYQPIASALIYLLLRHTWIVLPLGVIAGIVICPPLSRSEADREH